uniref:Uncharacterized protein n=1 Tax=Timema genevievae TaxID=629358 RepID=A0A7R9K9U0_TIMGE|nr:unnamed protein product [Timema genevievae]
MASLTCTLLVLAAGAILSNAQQLDGRRGCPINCALVRCAAIEASVCNNKYNGVSLPRDGCCRCCDVCYVSAGRNRPCSPPQVGVAVICQAGLTCINNRCQ